MSSYGNVYPIYRVEVRVPEEVFRRFGNTTEYSVVSYEAGAFVEESGQDTYSEIIEWGEAPTSQQCQDFLKHWDKWITQWEAQLRDES